MKILLIQPPLNKNIVGAGILYLSEPLALETIAAGIEQHQVKILDMRIEPNLEDELSAFSPDIVGCTGLTPDVYTVYSILEKVKKYNNNILTVVGGHHATMMPYDFNREFINVIVIGEGQHTFQELVDTYAQKGDFTQLRGLALPHNGKLTFTPERELSPDLDGFPFPARHLTRKYRTSYFRGTWRPVAALMTSRGCPFRCNFCAVWKHEQGKYRIRSAENIVAELEIIEEPYVSVCDDNFLQNIRRAEKLYQLIKERGIKKTFKLIARSDTIVKHPDIIEKWKEIGTQLVLIGIESIRDEELQGFNKQNTVTNNNEAIRILHKNGIEVIAQFIIKPDYTEDDFEALSKYAEKMKLKHPLFSVLTPLPGTDLFFDRYNEFTTYNYEFFDFVHSILPTKLPRKKFYKCLGRLYKKLYSELPSAGKSQPSPISSAIAEQLSLAITNAYNI